MKKFKKNGFTLLEVIVAIIILTIALAICFQAFNSIMNSWKKSSIMAENIQQGDLLINQISSSLRSIKFFKNDKNLYAFRYEENYINGFSADKISFVTSNKFFHHSKTFSENIPYRVCLFIDNLDNIEGLYTTSIPITMDEDDYINNFNPEKKLVSLSVKEFEILFWNKENKEWEKKWEKENSIPERILLSITILTSDNLKSSIYDRIINIPVSESLNNPLPSPSGINNLTTSGSSNNDT